MNALQVTIPRRRWAHGPHDRQRQLCDAEGRCDVLGHIALACGYSLDNLQGLRSLDALANLDGQPILPATLIERTDTGYRGTDHAVQLATLNDSGERGFWARRVRERQLVAAAREAGIALTFTGFSVF